MLGVGVKMHRPVGLSSPIYEMPLTDEELLVVGRIALLWGQIIFQLDHINLFLMRQQTAERLKSYPTLSLDNKLRDLYRELSKPENASIRSSLIELHQSLKDLKADRNVVFHGLWGIFLGDATSGWEPASKSYVRDEPFFGRDLFALHERTVNAAEKIDVVHCALFRVFDKPPTERNRRIAWKDGPPKDSDPPLPLRLLR